MTRSRDRQTHHQASIPHTLLDKLLDTTDFHRDFDCDLLYVKISYLDREGYEAKVKAMARVQDTVIPDS